MNVSTLKQNLKNNKLAKLFRMAVCPIPYPTYYEKCNVNRNMVLYESFYGKGMTCGPKALFDELRKRPEYKNLIHVWVVDDEKSKAWTERFEEYKSDSNVMFVKIKKRIIRKRKRYLPYGAASCYNKNNYAAEDQHE